MSTQIRGNKQIKSITITDSQIAPDAAISTSKLAEGAELIKRDGSVAFTGSLDLGQHQITNLSAPVNSSDAVRKSDLDEVAAKTNGVVVTREVPSGSVNGENTVFTLANVPNLGSEQVFVNGTLLNAGANSDYVISNDTLTFTLAPVSGDVILVNYIADGISLNPDVQSTLNQFDARLTTTEGELFSAQEDIATLQSADASFGLRVTSVEGDVSSIDSRVTSAEGSITSLNSSVSSLSSDISAEESARIDADDAIDARVVSLETTSASYGNRLNSVESDVTALESADSDMDVRVGALEDGLQAETLARQNAISGLADVATSGSYNDLSDKIPNASASVTGLVSTGSQTFAGAKTFSNGLAVSTTDAVVANFGSTGGDEASLFNVNHSSSSAAVGLQVQNAGATRTYFAHFGGVNWAEWGTNDGTTGNSSIRVSTASSTLGRVSLNDTNFNSQLHINTGAAGCIGLTVKGAAGQTADLQRWIDSSGAYAGSLNSYGTMYLFRSAVIQSPFTVWNALIAKGAAGQTASIFAVNNSANTTLFSVSATGSINNTVVGNALGNLNITSAAAATKGLIVKGAASQSAALFELQNSSGTVLFSINSSGSVSAGIVPVARVSGLADVATSGSYTDLTNKPSLFSGAYADLTGKPSLATVATSGSYNDLSDTPSLFSGSYNDLSDTPTIPSVEGLATESYVDSAVAGKADSSSLATVATSGDYADLSNTPTIYTPVKEVPSGTINGTNVTFTLSDAPAVAGTEQVFLNGLLQFAGAGDDYTISGDTITFNTAPEAGWKLVVCYFV